MSIKPFIPAEIINKCCKILQKNKPANEKLTKLAKSLVFIAPELIQARFWYGDNNCLGFTEILNNHCTKSTDKEIQKENEEIKVLYKKIIKHYKEKGFDKK